MVSVRLNLDGATLRSPRMAEQIPGRVLLHRNADGLALAPPGGPLDETMIGALGLLEDPEVRVDVDVAVDRSGHEWRAHSWQGLRAGRVATISTVDGSIYELSWLGDAMWRPELARAATVRLSSSPVPGQEVMPDLIGSPTTSCWRPARPGTGAAPTWSPSSAAGSGTICASTASRPPPTASRCSARSMPRRWADSKPWSAAKDGSA